MSLFPNKNVYHAELARVGRITVKTPGVRTSKRVPDNRVGHFYFVIVDESDVGDDGRSSEYYYNIPNDSIRQALEGLSGEVELEGFWFGDEGEELAGVVVRKDGTVVGSSLGAEHVLGENGEANRSRGEEEISAWQEGNQRLEYLPMKLTARDKADIAMWAVERIRNSGVDNPDDFKRRFRQMTRFVCEFAEEEERESL